MRILIAIQVLSKIKNDLQVEKVIQFSAQFVLGAAESPTILANIESGEDSLPPHVDTILTEACVRAPILAFRPKIRKGDPVKNILKEIESGEYDLLIMRDLADQRMMRLFRTTRTAQIADQTLCPVIITKGKAGPIKRILMCDSGGSESPLLGKLTAQLVEILPGEQEVSVLHVMSQISAGPGVKGEQLRADADELIKTNAPEGDLLIRDIESLKKTGLNPVPVVRHGLVVDEILAEARVGDYDLVVIGAHRKKWQQFLLDNLARLIIDQIDRPVLIAK